MAKSADTWKELKQKQKARITEIMFGLTCDIFIKTGQMPDASQYENLAKIVYSRCNMSKIQYEDILRVFIQKQKRFEERILEHGIPQPKPEKHKKTEAEKLAIKRENRRRRKLKKERSIEQHQILEQDDTFAYILGYTSGGAPYGLQWWEIEADDADNMEWDEESQL